MRAQRLGIPPEQLAEEMTDYYGDLRSSKRQPITGTDAVEARLARIKTADLFDDGEVVESERADLYEDLLEAIANGQTEETPQDLAKRALEARDF